MLRQNTGGCHFSGRTDLKTVSKHSSNYVSYYIHARFSFHTLLWNFRVQHGKYQLGIPHAGTERGCTLTYLSRFLALTAGIAKDIDCYSAEIRTTKHLEATTTIIIRTLQQPTRKKTTPIIAATTTCCRQAQSKPFFSGAQPSMAELASSSPVLGMQWAGPGSTEAAVSLLAAAGVSVPASPLTPPPPPPSDPDTGKKGKKKKKKKKV